MDENWTSEEEELPKAKKQRHEEDPPLEVKLLSAATGDTLLRLPRVQRSCQLGLLKEMIEAALRIPRPAQRLLWETQELKEDHSSLGSLLPQELKTVELTMIKQKLPPDALFREAESGNGSTCLAMFNLPDIAELLAYIDPATERSCLHAAAEQRLSATCLAILQSEHFSHLNLMSDGRLHAAGARWHALHAAVRSDLPDVCRAILSRSDYQGPSDTLSILHFAIYRRHEVALAAMVPLLSRETLLEPFPMCPFSMGGWRPFSGMRPYEVCQVMGLKEIANAIEKASATK